MEYGTDAVEMHVDSLSSGQRVVLVDDLIATGGTILAAVDLVRRLGGEIVECAFIVDLPDVGGSVRLDAAGIPWYAQTSFAGD